MSGPGRTGPIEFGEPDLPGAENHRRYDRLFPVYRSIYQNAKADMKALRLAARD